MSIVPSILASIMHIATTALVFYAFLMLHHMLHDIRSLKVVSMKILVMQRSAHIRQSLDELLKMRKLIKEYAENENYEAAKQLQEAVQAQEKAVNESIEEFNREFSDFAEIKIKKIK